MLQKSCIAAAFACALAASTQAQTAPRPTTTTTSSTAVPGATPTAASTTTTTSTTAGTGARARRAATTQTTVTRASDTATAGVRAAFDNLIEGIKAADVDAVMSVYWNSPQLVLFNNNGTVTRTWQQVRQNRESSYPNVTNVELELRDVRVRMLGRDGAVVSCLWTQSQVAGGTPESATGRLTVVFQRVATEWKAVHAHTSPDAPDPSRLLPSERTEVVPGASPATATPTATPRTPTPKKPTAPRATVTPPATQPATRR